MNDYGNFIPPYPLTTAVLFLVFKRPDTTKKVFEAIRKAKPPRLYIAADGPRDWVEGEAEKVKMVREYIMNNIDWDCEVKTLFRDKNLGCGRAVSEAITWFFEHEEMGIILEDDTVPSLSFFWFCEELLKKYKEDRRIMKISGYNLLSGSYEDEYDYVFTHFGFMWGWASWRRAWEEYDYNMKDWPYIKKSYIAKTYPFNKLSNKYFEETYQGKIDTWDYQFDLAIFKNYALSIVPQKSLIQNIGFGADATHTGEHRSRARIQRNEINFPLKHPKFVFRNSEYERMLLKFVKRENSIFSRVMRKIVSIVKHIS